MASENLAETVPQEGLISGDPPPEPDVEATPSEEPSSEDSPSTPDADQTWPDTFGIEELADAIGAKNAEDFMSRMRLTSKVSGETTTVTLADVLAGYQKGEDAPRKYEQAAQLRREAEALQQQYQQEQQAKIAELEQIKQVMQAAVIGPYQSIDWARLEQDSPEEFAVQKIKAQEAVQYVQQVEQQIAASRQEQAQQQQAKHAQWMAQQNEILSEKIDWWNDNQKAPAQKQALMEHAVEMGMNREEAAMLSYAPIIRALENSMRYVASRANVGETVRKAGNVPRLPRATPRVSQKDIKSREREELLKRGSMPGTPIREIANIRQKLRELG